MKTKLFLLSSLLIVTLAAKGQRLPVDAETQKITYTEVVDVTGIKKEDLYNRAKSWFVTGTGGTKLALELEDKETGKLLGKVVKPMAVKNPPAGMFEVGNVIYTITVIVKDDKYKYTITDFNHESAGMDKVISAGPLEAKKTSAKALTGNMPTQYQWGKIKEITEETALKQAESLKKVMSASAKNETDF